MAAAPWWTPERWRLRVESIRLENKKEMD